MTDLIISASGGGAVLAIQDKSFYLNGQSPFVRNEKEKVPSQRDRDSRGHNFWPNAC